MLLISNLNKTYPDNIKALDNVNLKIGKGIFGLIGPNGSGKSTLMRIIATLQEPDSGSVIFEGVDIIKQKNQMRSILGYLPQEFGVYPSVSAENLLDHLAVLKGIIDRKKRKEIINYLLEETNLYQYRKKKLGGFSGGMKQRFGIAQALLGQPKIIIVDEPTAGLDPGERDRFHNLLSSISENIIVIFSTHIVTDVNELCNDMAIIHKGKILIQTSPIKVIEIFQNKIWSKIIEKKEIESYSQKFKIISTKLFLGKIVIKVFSETPLDNFEKVMPTLEDVYFSYINSYIRASCKSLKKV